MKQSVWETVDFTKMKESTKALIDLKYKYGEEIQYYVKTARKIEDTDMCMVTLPCHNKDKKLMILVTEIEG